MKYLLVIGVVFSLLVLLSPCFVQAEEHHNWADQMGNLMSGKGNSFFRGEVVKAIDFETPFYGLDRLEAGVYTKIQMSEVDSEAGRYYEAGPTLRLIF